MGTQERFAGLHSLFTILCGWHTGVADHCFKDQCIKKHTIQKISIAINRELKTMCSKQVNSILQQSSVENFHWTNLIIELEEHAPIFSAILKACTRTKHERPNRLGVMGICAAIVLKYRYRRMSLVQKIISTVLHAGHSGKQVLACQHLLTLIWYLKFHIRRFMKDCRNYHYHCLTNQSSGLWQV